MKNTLVKSLLLSAVVLVSAESSNADISAEDVEAYATRVSGGIQTCGEYADWGLRGGAHGAKVVAGVSAKAANVAYDVATISTEAVYKAAVAALGAISGVVKEKALPVSYVPAAESVEYVAGAINTGITTTAEYADIAARGLGRATVATAEVAGKTTEIAYDVASAVTKGAYKATELAVETTWKVGKVAYRAVPYVVDAAKTVASGVATVAKATYNGVKTVGSAIKSAAKSAWGWISSKFSKSTPAVAAPVEIEMDDLSGAPAAVDDLL